VELVHTEIEGDLSLEELADAAGLSITHFSQMFGQSTGQSPHQFVLHRRIERAKEMLRAAERRVLDVAVACGFKSQQHFAGVFRRVYGASPAEYRQEFVHPDQPSVAEQSRPVFLIGRSRLRENWRPNRSDLELLSKSWRWRSAHISLCGFFFLRFESPWKVRTLLKSLF
jgi:AraC-like DNA-binding protein